MDDRAYDPASTQGNAITVEVMEPLDGRCEVFAMRIALGASVTDAAQRAGVGRTTGYQWMKDPRVLDKVNAYGVEAGNRARRELAGLVRQAVRTYKLMMQDASEKGAPTRLQAAKDVLGWARIDQVPVSSAPQRLITYVPRAGRTDDIPDDDTDTLDIIQVATQNTDLPTRHGDDGLPVDFPRHNQPQLQTGDMPEEWKDPQFWANGGRRSIMLRDDVD